MGTTVSARGQVTIPRQIRDLLGLKPGSKVDFRRGSDGNVILVCFDEKQVADRLDRWRGHADPSLSTDEIMALLRAD